MRRSRLLALVAATAVTGALAATPVASAAPAPARPHDTLASQLVVPLSLAARGQTVYVTQNFAGQLTRLRPGKEPRTVYSSKHGHEVAGVDVRGHRVVFTETAGNEQGNTNSWIKLLRRDGTARTLANPHRFEVATNPDGAITYGARGLSKGCARHWPTDQLGPATYSGGVDSHPYGTAIARHRTYIADAGMNAVLALSRRGHLRTVAVTPPVAVKITQQLADQMGVPKCAVGKTYYGESVPTDVEVTRHGRLLVTTEGGGLGEQMPLGAVYLINPRNGHLKQLAGGLMAPTGLAVARNGDLLVAQLFANEISRVNPRTGKARTFAKVALPAAVERQGRSVLATVNVLPPDDTTPPAGEVVRYRLAP